MENFIGRLHIHPGPEQLPEIGAQHLPFQVKFGIGFLNFPAALLPGFHHPVSACLNFRLLPLLPGRICFRQALPKGLLHGAVVLAFDAEPLPHQFQDGLGRSILFCGFPAAFQPLLKDALHSGIVGLLVGAFDQFLEVLRPIGGDFGLRLGVGLRYARLRTGIFREKLPVQGVT